MTDEEIPIYFTKHYRDCQVERKDWIFNVESLEDSLKTDEKLEWKLRNRGQWYKEKNYDKTKYEEGKILVCVVNNLQVYVGKHLGDRILIMTTYPFQKKKRKRLVKLEKFDIKNPYE